MALKGRAKFDEAAKDVAQSPRKGFDAFPEESKRRALQSVLNRVICGALGTAHTTAEALVTTLATGCQTGGTGGIGVANALGVIINGRYGTRASAGSYWLPSGTQSSETYVKYLIAGGTGTSGTVIAGNEATCSTEAYLPDCPDGYVALGYFEYCAGTSDWNRGANVCTGQTGSAGTGTFYDLVHMPWQEV